MARIIGLALASLLAANAAHAVEVTGAEAGLEFSTLTGDADDLNKFTASGSLELSFSQEFAIQGDVALSELGWVDESGKSVGLHAIYNAPAFSAGIFYGKDWIDGEDAEYYGLEGGGASGLFRGEGYIGRIDDGVYDGTIFGIRGEYAATDTVAIGARYDSMRIEGIDMFRLSLTAGYAVDNFELSGEVGRADADYIDSETFVSIGAKMNFGARNGTTFDRRGLLAVMPGL